MTTPFTVAFCAQKFRRNDILDLEGELSRRWPSYSGSNEVFWTHEWEKHGTCSAPTITSQHDYFLDVLKLHSKFNIEVRVCDCDAQIQLKTTLKGLQNRKPELLSLGAKFGWKGVGSLLHADSCIICLIWSHD